MALSGAIAAWCMVHLAIGALGTWLARRYALSRQLIDQPGERRSHALATPRGGGAAIAVSGLLALGWLAWTHAMPVHEVASLAGGLVLVAGIGWMDDHRPLSPWMRLPVQAAAAGLVAIALLLDERDAGTVLLGFATTMVLVNAWNFMDGIDGLAASQALLVAAGWAWLAWPSPIAWLLAALAASSLGFLPFNFPRARIFLGDVGSGSLGYLLAIGLLWLPAGSLQWPWLAWLALSAFLVDASLTLGLRMLRGERWWAPHLQHAYQRWALRLGRHAPVTWAYALWTACAMASIVLMRGVGMDGGAVAMGIGYAAATAIWAWMKRNIKIQEGAGQA